VAYDIALIGPTQFNSTEHSTYPIFSMWKTNNIDNDHYEPPIKAYAVLTHNTTKQHTIINLINESGKLPNPKKRTDLVYPPGYDKNSKTFRYGKIWRDISQKDVLWVEGYYSIQIVCGKMISNSIKVLATGTTVKPEDVINNSQAKKQPDSLVCNLLSDRKSDFMPDVPKDVNKIEIKNGEHSKTNDEKYTIYGSFNIDNLQRPSISTFPISFVIQQPVENGLIHQEAFLSSEHITLEDNASKGVFSYSIYNNFYNSHTNKFQPPENVFINVIIGDVISNTIEIRTLSQQ
jgi:hypothetical protein